MKKTLFLVAALALATTGASFAQTPVTTTGTVANPSQGPAQAKTPAQQADRHASKMAKNLGLSADQEAKVEQLMLARQQETDALKAKYATNKKAGRPEMKAAHDRYEAQMKTILTPEQLAKLDKMKSERHGHGHGKMKAKA